ncbi:MULTISPECIES: DUF883 family protein [Vitreoscilla]|uniref:DUF883 family protein n=1 Tax=Vitreoscilla stercoraria TaxID=61 RepID=A0ABY4EAD5_VITST|nr:MULTISPECIES: DUF883 family protein [Vitreoscilla]AUZ05908.1 hypothetical protein ADP71_26100 [Vitreoscilla sp. C1]UOO92722.1 DUF883 family protein [Vitreoscilla stercoraria]
MSQEFENRKNELLNDVREVLKEAETLYKSAVDDGSAEAQELKSKLKDQLDNAKVKYASLEATVADKAKETAKQADVLVHEKPYQALGIAAAAGLLLGVLLTRK